MTDNLTGLMWLKSPGSTTRTWSVALTDAGSLSACGNLDWRLPNILELESLVNLGQTGSASWLVRPENGFVGIARNRYWSSTTADSTRSMAWVIDFTDDSRDFSAKNLSFLAWPVRGETTSSPAQLWRTGQTQCFDGAGTGISCGGTGQDGDIQAGVIWPSPRFANPVNSTVKDNLTGLIWTANANTPGPSTCGPVAAKSSYESFPFIQCLNDNNYLGYNDWRLPNRKELESLLDHSQSNPALPSGHPFSVASSGMYWTSDTYISLCSSGWAVNLITGQASSQDKVSNSFNVWPVRGPLSMKILLAGNGDGVVSGNEISCNGSKCLGVYNSGDAITLTAESSADSVFGGWTGCTPAPTSENECTFLINTDITITATFLVAKSIWDKPANLNFGKVGVHVPSTIQYVAVKNLNDTNLQIVTVSLAGTNSGEFEFIPDEHCSGVTLLPGETCSIALSVNAQAYGTRLAELVVTSNDTKVPIVKIKLKAKAVPAKIYVKPKTLSFGRISTAGSASLPMTIENRGSTPLNISTITMAGDHAGDFTLDPSDCPVLQEGHACPITVTFAPGGTGKRTGTLVITSDAPKKGTVNVKLKGEGI